MTHQQVQVVQTSFRPVERSLGWAITMFYDRLLTLDPSFRYIVRTSREDQEEKLAHILTVLVKSLDNPAVSLVVLKELGLSQGGHGIQPRHYDTVGSALIWTVKQSLGAAFTPEVKEAWIAAYAMLAAIMQDAAAEVCVG